MNGNSQTPSHTRMVVICVTILASQAALTGAFLLWKGYQGGGELVVTLNTAISGLIGFLGGRATVPPKPVDEPVTTTISKPPDKPVPVAQVAPVPQPQPNQIKP